MSEMIEHKKEYFFSFDRIHRELKHLRSKYYDKYKNISELDLLCSQYLYYERIGYYNEVEWHRFGISCKSLPHMLDLITGKIECLRVLVYFRDHPHDILSDDSQIAEFEMLCCERINELMLPITKSI